MFSRRSTGDLVTLDVRYEVPLPADAHPPILHDASFHVDVHPEREIVRVVPVGELDLATAGQLERQLHELRDAGFAQIVLDLRELTFIDSSGIRIVVAEHQYAARAEHEFSLISGPPAVQRALEVCGLLGLLHVDSV